MRRATPDDSLGFYLFYLSRRYSLAKVSNATRNYFALTISKSTLHRLFYLYRQTDKFVFSFLYYLFIFRAIFYLTTYSCCVRWNKALFRKPSAMNLHFLNRKNRSSHLLSHRRLSEHVDCSNREFSYFRVYHGTHGTSLIQTAMKTLAARLSLAYSYVDPYLGSPINVTKPIDFCSRSSEASSELPKFARTYTRVPLDSFKESKARTCIG